MSTARAAGRRIGVDGTCLGSGRGYGRFLRELLPHLQAQREREELLLFIDAHTAEEVELPDLPTRLLRTGESQAGAACARGNRHLGDLLRMGMGVLREPMDAFFFPSLYSYFPIPARLPVALAIHDTIAERHGAIVFHDRRTRWLWNAKSRMARLQARTVITVSEYARRSIARVMGIASERIFVAPEAPSAVFQPVADPRPGRDWLSRRGIPQAPYLLYVGGFNPHKNLIGLVRSFAQLVASGGGEPEPGRRLQLLLVGELEGDVFHDNRAAIRREISLAGVEDRVHWTGYVPDAELRHLYAGALALVLPSVEEGFGLPAVEAAACGTPCVATRESPLPELLAGGGVFFDPSRAHGLRGALEQIVHRPEERCAQAKMALLRARELSWERTAARVWKALHATLERSS